MCHTLTWLSVPSSNVCNALSSKSPRLLSMTDMYYVRNPWMLYPVCASLNASSRTVPVKWMQGLCVGTSQYKFCLTWMFERVGLSPAYDTLKKPDLTCLKTCAVAWWMVQLNLSNPRYNGCHWLSTKILNLHELWCLPGDMLHLSNNNWVLVMAWDAPVECIWSWRDATYACLSREDKSKLEQKPKLILNPDPFKMDWLRSDEVFMVTIGVFFV
jgi:hypothetical protein